MKINDVTLTLFTWDGLQPVKYSAHVRSTRASCPGLGAEVDMDLVRRQQIAVLRWPTDATREDTPMNRRDLLAWQSRRAPGRRSARRFPPSSSRALRSSWPRTT